jgi:uncharacterized protein with HEPN domain
MRREELYLLDIIESTDHIEQFIRGKTFEEFQSSELLRIAVVQKLSAIGEAAGRVPVDLRSPTPTYHGLRSSRFVTFSSMPTLGSSGIWCG